MQLYISSIGAFLGLSGLDLVTAARRERIRAFRRAEDKARCLGAGLLLRRVCGVTENRQLVYGSHGKPYLRDNAMRFNLSHSGDYVVLATAGCEVGVDIERIESYSDAVAIRCFTPAEREWLSNNEGFYRLWTAKESVMKGAGLGFSLPPESFSVLPIDTSAHRIAGKDWFLDWIAFDGHMICRALGGKAEQTEFIEIGASELLL